MRKIFLALGFCVVASAAHATCTSPISSLNSTGSTITLGATVDALNNCWGGTAIVDGTAAANKMAVKAASTAPTATDPAAVVALSPNSLGGASGLPLFVQITAGAANMGAITNTTFASTQSGTWTVQPGNTPNTSPWLFTINNGGVSAAVKAGSTASAQTDPASVVRDPDLGSSADTLCTLPASSASCSLIQLTKAFANVINAAATAANQAAEIASLATIATNSGLPSNLAVSTTGGDTSFHVIAANSNNSTLISTGAHTVYEVQVTNYGTNLGDLRLYDLAGAPTCSSATGVIRNWPAQSNATSPGYTYSFPLGIAIASGLGICFTGAVADNDNTSFAGTNAAINIGYK